MTGAERIFKAVGNALYDTVMMIHVIIHLLKFVTPRVNCQVWTLGDQDASR